MNIKKVKGTFIMFLTIILSFGLLPIFNINHISMAEGTNSQIEDKIKPIIDYAYIEEGILKLSISDNEELARKPIVYSINKEIKSYEVDIRDFEYEYDGRKRYGKIYEIEVEIPSSIIITIKDLADNESRYSFTIKEDNVSLSKNIPEFILERLMENRQSKVNKFEGFKDIYEVEFGKVVNAFSLYDKIITNNYYSYSKKDIKFKVTGLSIDKDSNIKLDKYGVFKVNITHNMDKTFNESAFLLIKPDWKNSDNRISPMNFSPYIIYSDKIRIADYFKYIEESNNKNKGKIDTTYMLVFNEETNETIGMNDQINLELNKIYKLNVLNFENNSQQDFYIMRQEKSKISNKIFSDIKLEYWAKKDIDSLVSKGTISGYPNGTFNPTGNINIKEFMVILSRQIALYPLKAKPIVSDIIIPINKGSWGYMESKSILDRISTADLIRFNYINLDRDINREEVAFLINSTLELGSIYNQYMDNKFSDISIASYPMDISKLIDLGILTGYPDGTFKPKNNITRAEIAAIFTRIK